MGLATYLPRFYWWGEMSFSSYDFGNKLRYSKKMRYPVNMLQMSYTDTTDYQGEREPVGYGGFNTGDGFVGELATNSESKRPAKRQRLTGHGLGFR